MKDEVNLNPQMMEGETTSSLEGWEAWMETKSEKKIWIIRDKSGNIWDNTGTSNKKNMIYKQ